MWTRLNLTECKEDMNENFNFLKKKKKKGGIATLLRSLSIITKKKIRLNIN